jgi:hypothetical protein
VRQLAVGTGLVFIDRSRIAIKGFAECVRLYEVQWQEEHA